MKTLLKAAVTAIATLVASPSFAASVTLFDDPKCGGHSMEVTADTADLATKDFADSASSFQVKDGNWALYTGTNFSKLRFPAKSTDFLAVGSCQDLVKPMTTTPNRSN